MTTAPVAPIDLDIRRAEAADLLPLYRMLEFYQYDLSHFWDQDLDAHGEYGYGLDRYRARDDCHAFIARVGGRYAGFALVDRNARVGGNQGHWMDQFFVMKKYRRSGVGAALAAWVFAELPGPWRVGQMAANLPAQVFWRQVIGDVTGGDFTEQPVHSEGWNYILQTFVSRPRA